MKTKEHILNLLREKQPYLNAEFNVSRIGIFGSYARELSNERSDIDIVTGMILIMPCDQHKML